MAVLGLFDFGDHPFEIFFRISSFFYQLSLELADEILLLLQRLLFELLYCLFLFELATKAFKLTIKLGDFLIIFPSLQRRYRFLLLLNDLIQTHQLVFQSFLHLLILLQSLLILVDTSLSNHYLSVMLCFFLPLEK